jgi:segregation and condensation protein B
MGNLMNESHIRNVIEAALLAAGKPLQPAELIELFDDSSRPGLQDVKAALAALMEEYSNRGIEIKETAAGFRIQVRRELANEISRLWPERPARYSRALLETLALIAYRQPITRAEIEAVRGVAVNQNILKTMIERNWVRVVGHRDVPGRPELLGTTRDFLDYFGLRSLDELPPLAELKAIGDIKVQFDLPDPGPLALASDAGVATSAEGDVALVDSASQEADPAPENHVHADAALGEDAHGAVADSANVGGETEGDQVNPDPAGAGDDVVAGPVVEREDVAEGGAAEGVDGAVATADDAATAEGRDSSRKKRRRGKTRAPDSALHEAEEFAATVDADLAAGDDDGSDEDELSAAGPDSSELVAGPREIDD